MGMADQTQRLTADTQDCLARGSLFYTLRNILIWPCVICGLATAAYCYLARRLYIQFGWEECRILNASLQMKRGYSLRVTY